MAQIVCSTDARKVINKIPGLDRFRVEQMIFKAYPHSVVKMLDKYGTDEKNIKKVIAMCNNGYFKNVDRGIGDVPDWDKIMIHYYFLTEHYLSSDFPYNNIMAIFDMVDFSLPYIKNIGSNLHVKNLWYCRKVLIKNREMNNEDAEKYKSVEEIKEAIGDGKKGDKISTGNLSRYIE